MAASGRDGGTHQRAAPRGLYLYELAGDFHGLWNKGNDETGLRFIQDDDHAASVAKIALARAVAIVIAAGLGILGVTPADEMR